MPADEDSDSEDSDEDEEEEEGEEKYETCMDVEAEAPSGSVLDGKGKGKGKGSPPSLEERGLLEGTRGRGGSPNAMDVSEDEQHVSSTFYRLFGNASEFLANGYLTPLPPNLFDSGCPGRVERLTFSLPTSNIRPIIFAFSSFFVVFWLSPFFGYAAVANNVLSVSRVPPPIAPTAGQQKWRRRSGSGRKHRCRFRRRRPRRGRR